MRKLKSLVCGSKFGQFYIDAISKMKECVEFIGIFSNGSERSRLCAEKYNVNLYTSIDKIPEDIDIVFIAVRTGVMGGDGSELALKFLSKGIHVFIEQPIHIDEMKKCVKCSIEKGVFFHVANFYKYMDTVHKYIECSKGLLRKNEILSIECACANQVIYSLLDNILRIFREKARFSIENFWIQNQDFFIASGSINDIPLSIKVYNSVNTVDSDSYCYYLQQINIYTSEGMLFMVDVNGPIIWKPQFRAAHDLFIKKGDELDQRIFDSKMYWYESESELSYKDIFCKKWIDAIKKEIKEFIDNIYFEKMTEYRRKIQSEIVIPSIWGLITQKIGYPRLYQNANHAVDLNNYVLDFFEEKNTFLNDSLEIKKTANNIDFYLEPDITYGYVEEAKHIMNIACLESISYKLYEATGEKENISITEIVSCLKVADSNMHILQRWLNALSENGYIECNAGKIKWKKKNTSICEKDNWKIVSDKWVGKLSGEHVINYYLKHIEKMEALLSGGMNAALLLFPEGTIELANCFYRENLMEKYLAYCIEKILSFAIEHTKKDKIRILELGAGTGATTDRILKVLENSTKKIAYIYSDITKYFLNFAAQKYQGKEELEYKVINIDSNLSDQGIAEESVDIVIAAGMMNNAVNTDYSMRQIICSLVHGGIALIAEPVGENYELMLSQSFMMSRPTDAREVCNETFLKMEEWKEVFWGCGISERELVVVPSDTSPLAPLNQKLFIIRKE